MDEFSKRSDDFRLTCGAFDVNSFLFGYMRIKLFRPSSRGTRLLLLLFFFRLNTRRLLCCTFVCRQKVPIVCARMFVRNSWQSCCPSSSLYDIIIIRVLPENKNIIFFRSKIILLSIRRWFFRASCVHSL